MKKFVIIFITLLISITMLNGKLKSRNEPDSIKIRDPFGVCIYDVVPPIGEFDNAAYVQTLDSVKALGVDYIRTIYPFSWLSVEEEKGQWDFTEENIIYNAAKERGLKILPVIGFTPKYARNPNYPNTPFAPPLHEYTAEYKLYLDTLMSLYGDVIDHWEFWNEPYSKKYFTGTIDEYVYWYDITRNEIKSVDSTDKIGGICLAPVINSWNYYTSPTEETSIAFTNWEEIFDSIAVKRIGLSNIDFITFHVYADVSTLMNALRTLKDTIYKYNNGEDIPVWFTEVGYQNADPFIVDTYSYPDTLQYTLTYPGSKYTDTNPSRLIEFNLYNDSFFIDTAYAIWCWSEPYLASEDTFLKIGDTIRIEYGWNTGNIDTIAAPYNGGPIISNDGDTIVDIGDSIYIYHYKTKEITHSESGQNLLYNNLMDSLYNYLIENPNKEIKLFPFCMNSHFSNQYHPPILKKLADNHYKLYSSNSISYYSIINRGFTPFPAYYTYRDWISYWKDLWKFDLRSGGFTYDRDTRYIANHATIDWVVSPIWPYTILYFDIYRDGIYKARVSSTVRSWEDTKEHYTNGESHTYIIKMVTSASDNQYYIYSNPLTMSYLEWAQPKGIEDKVLIKRNSLKINKIGRRNIYCTIGLKQASDVNISIYKVDGRKIYETNHKNLSYGYHNFDIDLKNEMKNEVFFIKVKINDKETLNKKFTTIK